MTIDEIINKRRSVYPHQFTGEKIDDSIVWRILENANKAPNHKKTEPWRFTVFSGDGLKTFADLQVNIYKHHHPQPSEIQLKKLADFPLMASHVIAIGMKRHTEKLPEQEELIAMGCALENMFLTATAAGYGSYISTGGITYLSEAKQHFDLEAGDVLIGFFYLGVIREPLPPYRSYSDVKTKTSWVNT